jgi:hypothetical protein
MALIGLLQSQNNVLNFHKCCKKNENANVKYDYKFIMDCKPLIE